MMKRRFYIEDVVKTLGCHGAKLYDMLNQLGMKPKRQRGHGRHNRKLTAEEVERIIEAWHSRQGEVELRRLAHHGSTNLPAAEHVGQQPDSRP